LCFSHRLCRVFAFRRPPRASAANRACLPSIEQASTGNPMLRIQDVVKSFGKGVSAVDDVSLDLLAGVVGLIGHNGVGKTTFPYAASCCSRYSR
jgi:ABC-type glutathione transport system ATPase component